ncbi:hypothetical protein AA12717_0892 [Gluconacetobacter sacchari DSM 12717]|nr:hypothetical protein AA12717_0892 [Gluconacetobacter sacchari DSM 12717]
MSGSMEPHFTLDVPRRAAPRLVVARAGEAASAAEDGPVAGGFSPPGGSASSDSEGHPRIEPVTDAPSRREQIARIYTWSVTAGLLCGAVYLGWSYGIKPHQRAANDAAPLPLTAGPVSAPVQRTPAEASIAEMMGHSAPPASQKSHNSNVQAPPAIPAPPPAGPAVRDRVDPAIPATSGLPAPVAAQAELTAKPVDEGSSAPMSAAPSPALEQRLNDLAMRLVRTEALLTALRDDEKAEREASDRSIQSLRESIGAQSVRIQDLGARLDKPQETQQLSGRRATRVNVPAPREKDDGKTERAEAPPSLPRYHVVAGGPDMVMLHGVGNNDATFALRDIVPGYGHINAIEQEGDRWIVRTDKGLIK